MKRTDRERTNQLARARYERRSEYARKWYRAKHPLPPKVLYPGNTRVDYGNGLVRDFSPECVASITALLEIPGTAEELREATREWAESTLPDEDETGSVLPRGQGAAQAVHATAGRSGLPE